MAQANAVINLEINTGAASAALRSLQAQVNAFQSALNKNNAVQGAAGASYANQLMSSVNASKMFTAETVRMRTSAGQLDQTLSKGKGNIGQYFQSLRRGSAMQSQVMSLANARVSAMQTQFMATGAAAGGFREAIAIRPMQAFNSEAAIATERLAVQRAMFHQASTSMINFGKNTQWAGRQLMVGFTVPLTIFGALAGKTFMDMEKQVIAFKKVYGDSFTTPTELQDNINIIKELASEYTKYGIAASKTMELAAQAAAMGAKNGDLMDATTQSTRLATLGQMEQTKALETTIALQNAFGLSGEKLAKSVNFLNMVENQTVVTLQDLAEAIPRVAPVIKGLGGTVEDMSAMLAAMKEGGVSAAQGANALKSGLASLINPTDKAVESLSKMGINMNEIVQSNRGDLMGTVKSFATALKGLDQFGQQQALEKVFGKYQYARLGALFKNIVKDGTQASRVLDMAGMSAEQLRATAEKELGVIEDSAATKFTAAMEKMKLSLVPIGEMFVKMATPLIGMFTNILTWLNNLPDSIKRIGAFATIIVGLIIPAGTMFLGLLMNLMGTLSKFGYIAGVAMKSFVGGGFVAAAKAVSQTMRYMSLAEIDAVKAAEQLSGATGTVNAALRSQVGAADGAAAGINTLSGAYARLIVQMEQAAMAAGSMGAFAVPGIAMGMAGGRGGNLWTPAGAAGAAPVAAAAKAGRFARFAGMFRRNEGGGIPGVGNTDTVPAMLTPGEFVINKEATAKNLPLIRAINSGQTQGLNVGGEVQHLIRGGILRGRGAQQAAAERAQAEADRILAQERLAQSLTDPYRTQALEPMVRAAKQAAMAAGNGTPTVIIDALTARLAHANIAPHQRAAIRAVLDGGLAPSMINPRIFTEAVNNANVDRAHLSGLDQLSKKDLVGLGLMDDATGRAITRNRKGEIVDAADVKHRIAAGLVQHGLTTPGLHNDWVSLPKSLNQAARSGGPPMTLDEAIGQFETHRGLITFKSSNQLDDSLMTKFGYGDSNEFVNRMVSTIRKVKANPEKYPHLIDRIDTNGEILWSDNLMSGVRSLAYPEFDAMLAGNMAAKTTKAVRLPSRTELINQLGLIPPSSSDEINAKFRELNMPFKVGTVTGGSKPWPAIFKTDEFDKNGEMIKQKLASSPSKFALGGMVAMHARDLARSQEIMSALQRSTVEATTGRFASMPIANVGNKVRTLGGNSGTFVGMNGVFEQNGKRYVIKAHDSADSAIMEKSAGKLNGALFGLASPEQELIKMRHPVTGDVVFALRSPFDERFANPSGMLDKDTFTNQLIASAIRRDRDLQPDNLWGSIVGDSGAAIFGSKNGMPSAMTSRGMTDSPMSVSEMIDINLLRKKGGAKKWFAEESAQFARSMTSEEYAKAMKAVTAQARKRIGPAVVSLTDLTPEQSRMYLDRLKRDVAELDQVDWAGVHAHHASLQPTVKPTPTQKALEKALEERALRAEYRKQSQFDEYGLPKFAGGGLQGVIQARRIAQQQAALKAQMQERANDLRLFEAAKKRLPILDAFNIEQNAQGLTVLRHKRGNGKGAMIQSGKNHPFTVGHYDLYGQGLTHAAETGQDFILMTSGAHGNLKNNPLPANLKAQAIQESTGVRPNIITDIKDSFGRIKASGYDSVTVAGGDDRAGHYDGMLRSVGLEPKNLTITRNVDGPSGTLARQFALDGDYEAFFKMQPPGVSRGTARKLYNQIRSYTNNFDTPAEIARRREAKQMAAQRRKQIVQHRVRGGEIYDSTKTSNPMVPGVGSTDTVPAKLTPGEFVVKKSATSRHIGLLRAINNGGMIAKGPQHFEVGGQVHGNDIGQFTNKERYIYVERADGTFKGPYTEREARTESSALRREARRGGKATGAVRTGVSIVGQAVADHMNSVDADGNTDERTLRQQIKEARAAKRARQRENAKPSSGGRMALGMGVSMAAMLPLMMANDKNQFLGFDSGTASMALMGAGTLLSLPGRTAVAVSAAAIPIAAFIMAIKGSREHLDATAKAAYSMGSNLGGVADRMETVTRATGYRFAGARSNNRLFNFTPDDSKAAMKYADYFQSEPGKKYIDELKQLTGPERYRKISSEIALAVADGMSAKSAKGYGMAIAAFAGDAMLKQRVVTDYMTGKYDRTSNDAMVKLVEKRGAEIEANLGGQKYVPVAAGGWGTGMAKDYFGQQGTNATYGDPALGGLVGGAIGGGLVAAGGIGMALWGGASLGAAIGSGVPVIGTIIGAAIGALIGGGIAWLASNQTRVDIESNTKLATSSMGSAVQVLKEVANAEALLIEQRRTGIISTKEYTEQAARLEKVKQQATGYMDSALQAVATQVADPTATIGQVKDQLVLAGYEDAVAQALANTVNFADIAKELFPKKEMGDLTSAETNIVSRAIEEIFTGLTPENAASQIASVKAAWAELAKRMAQGMYAGATLTQQEDMVNAIAVGSSAAMQKEALMGDKGIPVAGLTDEEKTKLMRSMGLDPKDWTGRTFLDPASRMRLTGKDKATSIEAFGRAVIGKGNERTFKDVQNFDQNKNQADPAKAIAYDLKSIADGGGQDFWTSMSQAMMMSPKLKSYMMGTGGKNLLQEMFPDMEMQAINGKMNVIYEGLRKGLTDIKLVGPIEDAQNSFEQFFSKNSGNLKKMGVDAKALSTAIAGVTDQQALDGLTYGLTAFAENGAGGMDKFAISADEAKTSFARLVALLPEGIDMTSLLTNSTENALLHPINTVKKINKELKTMKEYVKKIDVKKFGDNWKQVKDIASKLNPKQFINIANALNQSQKWGTKLFKDTIAGENVVSDAINKNPKMLNGNGNVKSKMLTEPLIQEVILSYGGNAADAGGVLAAIQSQFPGGSLNPMYIPIIAQFMGMGYSAETVANAIKGKKTTTTTTASTSNMYGMNIANKKVTQTNPLTGLLSGMFNTNSFGGALPQGTGGGNSGGGGQKSLSEQLSDALKLSRDFYNTLHKLMYTKKEQMRDSFKAYIAGPFAPEFLSWLKEQGAEGLKILKKGIKAVAKEYDKFQRTKTFDMGYSEALVGPSARREEARRKNRRRNMTVALQGQGMSSSAVAYVNDQISDENLAAYAQLKADTARLQAIPKGKLTKAQAGQLKMNLKLITDFERNIKDAIQKSGVNMYIEQVQAVADAISEAVTQTKTFDILAGKGIGQEAAQSLMDLGVSAEMAATMTAKQLRNLVRTATNLKLHEKFREIATALHDMITEAKNLKTINMLGFTGDTASAINDMIGPMDMTVEQIKEVARAYQAASIEAAAFRTEEQKALDIIGIALETTQATIDAVSAPYDVEINKLNDLISAKQHDIDLEEQKKKTYQDQIKAYQDQEDALQKAYDARIKALDEVEKANARIADQQKGQLDIANALSRGDVAAAAQAAQDLQQKLAAQNITDARDALQNQLEAQKEAIQDKIDVAQAEIDKIDKTIDGYNQQITGWQNQIYDQQKALNDEKKKQGDLEERIYKLQLLQSILQTQQALNEAAGRNDAAAVDLYKAQLAAQVGAVGKDPAAFFAGVPGAEGATGTIGAANASIAASTQAIIAEKINPIMNDVLNGLIAWKNGLIAAGQTVPPKLDIYQDANGNFVDAEGNAINFTDLLTNLAVSGIQIKDLLILAGAEKINSDILPPIDAALKTTQGILSELPKSAQAIYNSFEAANLMLQGKINEANAVMAGLGTLMTSKPEKPGGPKPTGNVKRAFGGFVPGIGSSDSVSAMLTPGEFVVRKPIAQQFGKELMALNGQVFPAMGTSSASLKASDSGANMQYNYSISVNVAGTNASPDEIANAVMGKIKMAEGRNVRGYNFNG